jgi:hypothetical protein
VAYTLNRKHSEELHRKFTHLLAQRLREWWVERSLSVTELARQIKTTRWTLYRFISKPHLAHRITLSRISRFVLDNRVVDVMDAAFIQDCLKKLYPDVIPYIDGTGDFCPVFDDPCGQDTANKEISDEDMLTKSESKTLRLSKSDSLETEPDKSEKDESDLPIVDQIF